MGRVKFTIHGFQQKKLIEAGLDNNDALVMSVIKDMYASASVESLMINGDRYIWVNQTQLHKFVPILGSLKTVQRIFSKLRKANLLDSHVTHEKKGVRGTFYFIKPTQLFDDLTEYVAEVNTPLLQGGGTNCPRGVGQNDGEGTDKMSRGGKTKCPNKDSSTIDSSTRDSLSYDRNELIKKWNAVAPRKVKSIIPGSPRDRSIKARISEYGLDALYEAIDKIPNSDLLSGKVVNPKTGKRWRMTLDWFIGPSNFQKVYEGNYDPDPDDDCQTNEFGSGNYGENVIPNFDFSNEIDRR